MQSAVTFARLAPGGAPAPAHELLAEVQPRERAGADTPFLFLNMVASVDGRASREGRAHGLGEAGDLEMLLELRALGDAVLIGSRTLRAEGYARLVRAPLRRERRRAAGLAEDPLAVLISRELDLPWEAGLFAAEEQPVLVYTSSAEEPPEVAAPLEIVRLADPSPAAVLTDLRARGVRALLCEGGPTLNHSLLIEGLVDELFLTVVPVLTSEPDAIRILEGPVLPSPTPLELLWVLEAGGELFLRYGVT